MEKFLFSLLIGSLILTVGLSQGFAREKFPVKPIKLIVPYAAGGGTDQIARILEKVMPKYLPNGQSIAVINSPAGSNIVGTTEVFQATPDGYKLELIAVAPLSITPLYENTPYTHDSFSPVCKITSIPPVLAVRKDSPWKTFDEWLAWIKKNPDRFIYGSAGVSSAGNVAMQPLISASGIKIRHIAFNGGATAITALLGGHVQGYAGSAQEMKSPVESGQVKILLNLGTTKAYYYKKIPLITDKGYSTMGNTYYGIIGPKGLPKEVIAVIQKSCKKALADPEVKKFFKTNGILADYAGAAEFQKEITTCFYAYQKTLKKLGLIK